jgi:hypothetical protein
MSVAPQRTRSLASVTTAATDDAILTAACARVGLDSSAATPLRRHATSVWLLRGLGIVVRIDHSGGAHGPERAVAVTRWLLAQGFPSVEPLDVGQPVVLDGVAVTFWRYYDQNDRPAPSAGALGGLLRQLHGLPEPPVAVDDYVPLAHLGRALEHGTRLPADDRAWLVDRRRRLLDAYGQLDSALGVGFIHGDAYPGNMLWDGQLARLGDWDEVARGPRELDLVNTNQGARFGRSMSEREAFNDAYGWNVTKWSGYPILREMRDLHTLGAFIERVARGDALAAAELERRIATLRSGDTDATWNAT